MDSNKPKLMASKYKNVKCTADGFKFDSKAERDRYYELKILQMANEIRDLRLQVKFPIEVAGKKICNYIADFTYYDKEGFYIVEDKKGFRTTLYNMKKKLLKAVHGIDIKET